MKYALVKSMAELSKTANISLIAEGVETQEEFSALIDLGVQHAQGYYLKRPEDDIGDIGKDVRDFIVEQNRRKNHMPGNLVSNIYIQNICTKTETIPPDMNTEKVFEKMKGSPNTYGLCVVADGNVLGIMYFDIDNFKAYNDVYGFESGDKIIKLLASSLTAHLPPVRWM